MGNNTSRRVLKTKSPIHFSSIMDDLYSSQLEQPIWHNNEPSIVMKPEMYEKFTQALEEGRLGISSGPHEYSVVPAPDMHGDFITDRTKWSYDALKYDTYNCPPPKFFRRYTCGVEDEGELKFKAVDLPTLYAEIYDTVYRNVGIKYWDLYHVFETRYPSHAFDLALTDMTQAAILNQERVGTAGNVHLVVYAIRDLYAPY